MAKSLPAVEIDIEEQRDGSLDTGG